MNKLVLTLTLLTAVTLSQAAEPAKSTVTTNNIVKNCTSKSEDASFVAEAGWNSHYVVNGVARSSDSAYVGVSAIKPFKYLDVYIGGVLLPNSELDQSHWFAGFGKDIVTDGKVTLRLDAVVWRHQNGGVGEIQNSTEIGPKLTLENPWITPYVRGAFDIDLHQDGWFAGVEKVVKLPLGFTFTPAAEYGESTDYTALNVKATLARPIGKFTPYATAGWYDNDLDGSTDFATREFNGKVVYSAGLRFAF